MYGDGVQAKPPFPALSDAGPLISLPKLDVFWNQFTSDHPMSVTANPEIREIWTKALSDESAFWQAWFETKGGQWPDDYAKRVDPELPLQPELRELLEAPEGSTVRVLDVGAGPLTMLGKVWPGRIVDLVAVDPLARQYDEIMEKVGVTPLVRTQAADGEKLSDVFPAASFDLVHARNCLDHSYDPVLCLKQMFALVKPGGHVVTTHFNNEAGKRKLQWPAPVEFLGGAFELLAQP